MYNFNEDEAVLRFFLYVIEKFAHAQLFLKMKNATCFYIRIILCEFLFYIYLIQAYTTLHDSFNIMYYI